MAVVVGVVVRVWENYFNDDCRLLNFLTTRLKTSVKKKNISEVVFPGVLVTYKGNACVCWNALVKVYM